MKKKHFIIISFAVIMLLIGIDQLTKWLCNTNEILLSGDKIEVIKNFISFRLAYNKGAAWSILEGHTWLLVAMYRLLLSLEMMNPEPAPWDSVVP